MPWRETAWRAHSRGRTDVQDAACRDHPQPRARPRRLTPPSVRFGARSGAPLYFQFVLLPPYPYRFGHWVTVGRLILGGIVTAIIGPGILRRSGTPNASTSRTRRLRRPPRRGGEPRGDRDRRRGHH